jgi:hypothetical protein
MTTSDLTAARVRRHENCMATTCEELLALVKDDLANGGFINAKRMAIIVVDEDGKGNQNISAYRCGMNRAEEIGYLEMAKDDRKSDWVIA